MSRASNPPHPHAYPPIDGDDHRGGGDRNAGRQMPTTMFPLILAALAANFGGFIMGTAVGWTGPALHLIINNGNMSNDGSSEDAEKSNHEFPVSTADGNWIASLFPLGALLGGLIGGQLIGGLGRKLSMYIITIFYAVGFLMLAAAVDKYMLFFGRFISGLGTGLITITIPNYVAEISSANVRGVLGACFQVMITLGVLYVDIVGAFVYWRWISVACVALVFIWSLALLYIPESPAFLLIQRDFDGARDALISVRGHPYVETELSEMQEVIDQNVGRKVSILDLAKSENLKPLLISLLLMFGQQFSGINAVIFFSVTIFEAAKTSLDSFVESIIVAGTMVGATILAATVIDRLGRRFLLNISTLGMIISLYALGTYFWIQTSNPTEALSISFLPVTSLSIYILAFSVGYGPIPWIMMSEIFAPEMKTLASSISASFNWALCFCVAMGFEPLASAVGKAAVFWGFGSILVVTFIIGLFVVPETKGRSLEQIQELFRRPAEHRQDDEQDMINNAVDDLEAEIHREANIVQA